MKALKERVYEANMELVRKNLIVYTWGNVSEVDRAKGVVAIKPSGVPYEALTPDQIVILSLEDGRVVEGTCAPLPMRLRILCCIGLSGILGALPTPIPAMPHPGPRRANRCPVSAPPMRIPSTAKCPAPVG